jgi:hypothetical protein
MNHEEMSYEESLEAADELIELMREHELDLARIMEPLLFPDGSPPALSVAEIMRAQARLLARSAQSMAEADIAYNAALQKHRPPNPQQTSLISQDVAQKLALSAELESLVFSMAEEIEAKVTPKLFPEGLPPDMTLLGFLQSLRECVELERSRMPEPPGGESEGDEDEGEGEGEGDEGEGEGDEGEGEGEGDSGEALAALHQTINTIATIYSGFCDQGSLEDLAEQVRAYTSAED